jgi:predicted  nucleic acid-binding Zn-ribbon protein
MMHEVEALEQRVNALDQRVRKEVGKIREDVKQEISTLTRDDVADALNAELAEFRRLDVPSQRNVNF